MAQRALVTGAGGFIGSHVVRQLVAQNWAVRAMLAPGEAATNLNGLNIETVEADVTDAQQVLETMKDCDTVFHLAALYVLWMKDPGRMYAVNVGGTQNIMEAAKQLGVQKVVHTSSIAAIGVKGNGQVADEDTPFSDYDVEDHYVLSKHRSEQLALQYAKEGVPVVVVNPGFPFGPGDLKPTPTGRMVLDVVRQRLPGYVAGGLNAVDVEDVARGHLLAAEKGRVGERYCLVGTNITYGDFLRRTAELAQVRLLDFEVPFPLAKVLSHGFVWGKKIFNVDPIMTPGLLQYISRELYFDNRKAREELGLEFTPLDETIKKSIHYFRHEWGKA